MSTTPQTYFTLLTAYGAAAFANAPVSGTMVNLSHLAVGDGGGVAVKPTEAMKTLVNEVHRVPISSVTIDPDNPNWVVIEAVLPSNIGGWTIRETGLIGDSKFLSIGNFPETYKPFLAEGASKDLTIRMIVQVSNAGVVNLTVDPSVTVLTQQGLVNALLRYYTKTEADTRFLSKTEADTRFFSKTEADARYLQTMPIASTTVAGIVELATVTEAKTGTDSVRAVTPAGLAAVIAAHAADPDPHVQYLTQSELDAQLVAFQVGQRAKRMFFAGI